MSIKIKKVKEMTNMKRFEFDKVVKELLPGKTVGKSPLY